MATTAAQPPPTLAQRIAEIASSLGHEPGPPPPPEGGPVHVIYGGAHLFKADAAPRLGALALRALDTFAPDEASLASATGLTTPGLRARVAAKLEREAVEDLRIDFEDGYGQRPDAEEDEHARKAAAEVAQGLARGSLPRGLGIRIKALAHETRARSLRTLTLFFAALRDAGTAPPAGFVVTLPKVTRPAEVEALRRALEAIEDHSGWGHGSLRIELMIETPASLVASDGRLAARSLVDAAAGRCDAVHFGTYDYTASLGITAAHQRPGSPACELALGLLQLSLAGTGVRISDGATIQLPIPPHRGDDLSGPQRDENLAVVSAAWKLHIASIQRALAAGIYQGWDLHPAQLVTRHAAVHAFFDASAADAGRRLKNFVDRAAQATRVGATFDDAATGQGLLNYFRRALACGALAEPQVLALTGLPASAFAHRTFGALLASL